ncbi:FAD-binding protein [Gelidibacter sp. DF109]|uniref:FAD-binding protein n=1 Tax=Gelidibacter pelagius TaxID=2819985 RepID=A0ABS3SW82_9FLAO|nr:FAD-binding protein [Gelidibacter pelagius]
MELSDIGACGGLMVDEHGRVLWEDKTRIEGLYAVGNTAVIYLEESLGCLWYHLSRDGHTHFNDFRSSQNDVKS